MIDALSRRIRKLHNCDIGDGNIVYIATNEVGTERVTETLKIVPRTCKSCHVGFSGWYNFDLVAIRRSDQVILCDINPHQVKFLKYTLQFITISKTRQEFVTQICNFVDEQKQLHDNDVSDYLWFDTNIHTQYTISGTGQPQEVIAQELNRSNSWLSTDDNFYYIQSLVFRDKIAVIVTDIGDYDRFTKIYKLLDDNFYHIDTLYLSNIIDWVPNSDTTHLNKTLSILINPASTLIIACRSGDLIQRIIVNGKLLG